MTAPCVFIGLQEAIPPLPPLELYNLTSPIPQHGVGSTMSRRDIERAGYVIPESEATRAKDAWHTWNNAAAGDDHLMNPVL
jgi:hypothetical protein